MRSPCSGPTCVRLPDRRQHLPGSSASPLRSASGSRSAGASGSPPPPRPLALGGTAAAAAYAAVLPTPVQHLAHNVLGFAGVPDTHQGSSARTRASPATTVGRRSHPATAPVQADADADGIDASRIAVADARRVPDGIGAPPAGPSLLSASAASAQITAGSEAVIDGR